MELSHRIHVRHSLRAKLIGRMKLGQFFALPEKKFSEYIKEIEEEENFQELLHKYRIVRYRKFPGIKPAPASLEFKEELTPGDNFDLIQLIQKDPQGWQIVRKVAIKTGQEKFSRFLGGDDSMSLKEIFQECNLSSKEIGKFKDFINRFQLQESFFSSDTSFSSLSRAHLCRVACIENREGELFICPVGHSTYLVKGRFVVDYGRWENLIQDKQIPPNRIKKMSSLFRKLDLINRRTTTLYRIVDQIKEKQRQFLMSGDARDLVPLAQREIAHKLGVNPSTTSRAIANKSIITPRGREQALKDFFPGEKEKIKGLKLQIVREELEKLKEGVLTRPLTDEEIRVKLRNVFGVEIARRTVVKYRKESKIPSSRRRKL